MSEVKKLKEKTSCKNFVNRKYPLKTYNLDLKNDKIPKYVSKESGSIILTYNYKLRHIPSTRGIPTNLTKKFEANFSDFRNGKPVIFPVCKKLHLSLSIQIKAQTTC